MQPSFTPYLCTHYMTSHANATQSSTPHPPSYEEQWMLHLLSVLLSDL